MKLSATQVATYRDCQRKWAWERLDGIPRPQATSAAFGEGCHTVGENYLRHGLMPDPSTPEGRVMAAGLAHLPKPKTPGLEVELEIKLERPGYVLEPGLSAGDAATARVLLGSEPPIVYTGRIDWTTTATVGDHKTTSALGWAKTPEELRNDPQVAIYGSWRAARDRAIHGPAAQAVAFRWVYYQTKGAAKSKPVHLVLSHDEIEASMLVVDADARAMLAHHKRGKKALDLLPTPTHCQAYGGCPYVDHCKLTDTERLKGHLAMASLREKMLAAQAAKAGTPAPAAPEPPPAPAPPPAPKPALPVVVPGKPAGGLAAKLRAVATQTTVSPAAPAVDGAEAPPLRERPSKQAARAEGAAQAEPVPLAQVAKQIAHKEAKRARGFTLYVDCRPTKGEISLVAELPDVVAAIAKGVAETNGVEHYRFIHFGAAVGALENSVIAHYESGELDVGDGVVLDTRTQLGQDLLGCMTRLATTVIRGQ